MDEKRYEILKAGDECPVCKEVWGERRKSRVQRIIVECDSTCRFRAERQKQIDASGLDGFICKDDRWGPWFGALCQPCFCKFALNTAYKGSPNAHNWMEGYPRSWDGWSR